MKKILKTFILAICLVFPAMFCLTACGGEKEEYKPFNYTIDKYGGVTINGFKDGYKTSTSITIPNAVVEISRDAFRFCEALESVTFEEGCKLTTISLVRIF